MLNIQKGQKAKAISSGMHNFEDGAEITFVEMADCYSGDYDVYIFKGIINGEIDTQHLEEFEFELI